MLTSTGTLQLDTVLATEIETEIFWGQLENFCFSDQNNRLNWDDAVSSFTTLLILKTNMISVGITATS